MSDSNAVSAHGTVLKWNDDTVLELRDLTPPALSRKPFDVSIHNADDDQYVMGIRRMGLVTFMVNWLSSGTDVHADLLEDWGSNTKGKVEIDFPDGGAWVFSGFVADIAIKSPAEGPQEATISIRPTGTHVFTP